MDRSGGRSWSWCIATAAAAALVVMLGACTVSEDEAGDSAAAIGRDELVGIAVGRWRCEGTADHRDQDILIAIARGGRLAFVDLSPPGGHRPPGSSEPKFDLKTVAMPHGGRWKLEGLELDLDVPWYGEGAHGFNTWRVTGDQPVPERVEARQRPASRASGGHDDTDLRVELHRDRVDLVQVRAKSGTISPRWRLSCEKIAAKPGMIAPPEDPWTAD